MQVFEPNGCNWKKTQGPVWNGTVPIDVLVIDFLKKFRKKKTLFFLVFSKEEMDLFLKLLRNFHREASLTDIGFFIEHYILPRIFEASSYSNQGGMSFLPVSESGQNFDGPFLPSIRFERFELDGSFFDGPRKLMVSR